MATSELVIGDEVRVKDTAKFFSGKIGQIRAFYKLNDVRHASLYRCGRGNLAVPVTDLERLSEPEPFDVD